MLDKTVLVPIANGTEEMEAVIIIDMLRRAGIDVVVAGDSDIISCSRGVKIIPDIKFEELENDKIFDAIVIPGGLAGVEILKANTILKDFLISHNEKGVLIGAICAAPELLSQFNIISSNYSITSHPSIKSRLSNYNYKDDNVVIYKNIITSRGAGTAFDFSLKIIEYLGGNKITKQISDAIVLHTNNLLKDNY